MARSHGMAPAFPSDTSDGTPPNSSRNILVKYAGLPKPTWKAISATGAVVLPQAFDAVLLKRRIGADYGQVLNATLGGEQAVKWIPVVKGERLDFEGVL